jgi:hypothetical protein
VYSPNRPMTTKEMVQYLETSERKAWVSLAAGKWDRFGYWAAHTVHLRRLLGLSREPSPFSTLVTTAKRRLGSEAQHEIDWVAAQDDQAQLQLPTTPHQRGAA